MQEIHSSNPPMVTGICDPHKSVTFKNRQPQKGLLGCILPGCTQEKLLRNYYQILKMIYCSNHEKLGFQMI